MNENKIFRLSIVSIIAGATAFYIKYNFLQQEIFSTLVFVLNLIVPLIYIIQLCLLFAISKYYFIFIKKYYKDLFFILISLTALTYFYFSKNKINEIILNIFNGLLFIRNIVFLMKLTTNLKKLSFFLKKLTDHPAKTILLSFIAVIIIGTIILMMPFVAANKEKLSFIDSLFTATSAVCVTGLIVVDTAQRFSIYGKVIIMTLIQIGGLGIMLLSFFTAFIFGKQMSIEEQITISFMLNESDIQKLYKTIKSIVFITFFIEGIGASLLFLHYYKKFGLQMKSFLFSIFHAVSAFCNAGFALYTDSLCSFRTNPYMILIISSLIILGGISFRVIINFINLFKFYFKKIILKEQEKKVKLSLNTKIVIIMTITLITFGFILFYLLELRNTLVYFDIKTEYLSAFFQSITLRTAGFNTIDISKLRIPTYLIMVIFMFIGAASGSTAGGVKVNTIAVIYAYIKSILANHDHITLLKHTISKSLVNKAFLIVIIAFIIIFVGIIALSITENQELDKITFEVVSAFGTVGLSTGITSELTTIGKSIIIVIMFIGRLGPLTIMAALSGRTSNYQLRYSKGFINIG